MFILSPVVTTTVRKNAHVHILAALKASVASVPLEVSGLNSDNGSEFLNCEVIGWASTLGIYLTRSRPYRKNDRYTIESKTNHLVHKYGFYCRCDKGQSCWR